MMWRAPLVLTCGAALLALARAEEQCDSAQIGNTTGDSFVLEQHIEPDLFTLEISEPDMCEDAEPVGLKVTACDLEQAPHVYLMDAMHGLVVREGALETAASVYITVFCPSDADSEETSSEASLSLSPRLSSLLSQSSSTQPQSEPLPPPQPTSTLSLLQTWVDSAAVAPVSNEGLQSATETKSVDPLPAIKMESRFSVVPKSVPSPLNQFNLPLPTPSSVLSRWKDPESQLLEQSKPPLTWVGSQPNFSNVYPSLLQRLLSPHSKEPMSPWAKYSQPPRTETSNPLLAKRLSESLPEKLAMLSNRSPAWLKRPPKGPESSWLKQRSNAAWPKRRSLYQPRVADRYFDEDDPWLSQYEEDQHSNDDHPVHHWLIENGQSSRPHKSVSWRPKSQFAHRVPEEQHQSPQEHSPYIHYPATHQSIPSQPRLADWKDKPTPIQGSKHSSLPKLLLLLQDPENSYPPQERCATAHTLEKREPWLPNYEDSDDGIPWQPEYPSDYTADDGDALSWPSGREDDIKQMMRHVSVQNENEEPNWHHPLPKNTQSLTEHPASPQWCPKCPTDHSIDSSHMKLRHPPTSYSNELPWPQPGPAMTPQTLDLKPSHIDHSPYALNPLNEQPLLNPDPRAKTSNSNAPAPPPAEQADHHAPAAPWSYLSNLLLSHPSFRDSTHVIRI